ncbi:hypothetical protein MTO96_009767 [Rhipicephalus appendiculatus]
MLMRGCVRAPPYVRARDKLIRGNSAKWPQRRRLERQQPRLLLDSTGDQRFGRCARYCRDTRRHEKFCVGLQLRGFATFSMKGKQKRD